VTPNQRLKVCVLVDNAMGDFIGLCVIAILALSPLLRRFYIDRFWIHARGIVIRVELVTNDNPEGGAWVWTPIIEYQAAGQQFSSRVFPFRHRLNAKKSKYSVGDEVDILYDPRDPSRVMLDSWAAYILCTILLSSWFGIIIVDRLHNAR
jgi:hypothetical protein